MMLRITRGTEARKPGLRGEHEGNRNTIARGMPDCFGKLAVTTLVCFLFSHARLRVRRASGIPCALLCFGGFYSMTRARLRRGNAKVYLWRSPDAAQRAANAAWCVADPGSIGP